MLDFKRVPLCFPGSGVVTYYLRESGVIPYLETLGFHIVGYGCMTCIGNSGPLDEAVSEAVKKGEIVACGVLSGANVKKMFYSLLELQQSKFSFSEKF